MFSAEKLTGTVSFFLAGTQQKYSRNTRHPGIFRNFVCVCACFFLVGFSVPQWGAPRGQSLFCFFIAQNTEVPKVTLRSAPLRALQGDVLVCLGWEISVEHLYGTFSGVHSSLSGEKIKDLAGALEDTPKYESHAWHPLNKVVETPAAFDDSLKALTSLQKEVRPFFLGDNIIWSLPSVSSLSRLAITTFGGPEGYFSLAIIAFGAFGFIVPKIYSRLGKWKVRSLDFKGAQPNSRFALHGLAPP